MHSGHFFHLDYWSDESRHQHIFIYHKIRRRSASDIDKLTGIDELDAIPVYPIYMTMNPEAITFHFIGLKHWNPQRISPYSEQEDRHSVRPHGNVWWSEFKLQHYEMLLLPLSPDMKLKEALSDTLVNTIGEITEFDDRIYHVNWTNQRVASNGQGSIYYSNLEDIVRFSDHQDNTSPIFDTDQSILLERWPGVTNSSGISTALTGFSLSKRELILDFLFDFKHSRVFQNSPYLEVIETKLKECKLLDAIINKCEYYYTREKYLEVDHEFRHLESMMNKGEPVVEDALPTQKVLLREWSDQLIDAERDYLDIIFDPGAGQLFMQSGGWFFPVERELKAVMFNDDPQRGLGSSQWKRFLRLGRGIFKTLQRRKLGAYLDWLRNHSRFSLSDPYLLFGIFLVLNLGVWYYLGAATTLASFLLSSWYLISRTWSREASSIWEKSIDLGIFQREYWQKKHRQFFEEELDDALKEGLPEMTGAQIQLLRSIRDYQNLTQQIHRNTNNFLLGKFNLIHAYRNALPHHLRLAVGRGIFISLVICMILAAGIILGCWVSWGSDQKYEEFNLMIRVLFLIAGVVIFAPSMAYLLFRYNHLTLDNSGLNRVRRFFLQPKFLSYLLLHLGFFGLVIAVYLINLETNHLYLRFLLVLASGLTYFLAIEHRLKSRIKSLFARIVFPLWIFSGLLYLSMEFRTGAFLASCFFLIIVLAIKRRKKIVNLHRFNFNLILPRLQMAIVSSWIIFISTEELWKANLKMKIAVLSGLYVVIGVLALYFLIYVIMKKAADLEWISLMIRASAVLIYGFFSSLVFGVLAMGVIGYDMIANSGILNEWYPLPEEVVLQEVKQELQLRNTYLEHLRDPDQLLLLQINEGQKHRGEYATAINDLVNSMRRELISYSHIFRLDTTIRCVPDSTFFVFEYDLNRQLLLQQLVGLPALDERQELEPAQMWWINDTIHRLRNSIVRFHDELAAGIDRVAAVFSEQAGLFRTSSQFEQLEQHHYAFEWDVLRTVGLIKSDSITFSGYSDQKLAELWSCDGFEDYVYRKEQRRYKLQVYPRLLLFNTLLAMFIGIFIQVITQDRSVTEPL